MNSNIIKTLEQTNIKPTPMRMLVLEQLMVQQRHLSLSDIEELLYPSDRVTIYRTLQTFVSKGLVHAIETAANGSMYALCSDGCKADFHNDNHPHFFCSACHSVTCTPDFVVNIVQKPNSPKYQLAKAEVTLKGLCPNCIKQ